MESSLPQLFILAEAPGALYTLFGVSLLERLLRTAQRLGFRQATVFSQDEAIRTHLAAPSWARAEVALTFQSGNTKTISLADISPNKKGTLLVSAGFYYDARLLQALSEQKTTALLIDSAPPAECANLWNKPSPVFGMAALLERDWLARADSHKPVFDQLASEGAAGKIETCDAARQPTYLVNLRKHVRPVFFPAPPPALHRLAEKFPRDLAQNSVLDFPGQLDSPIEDWIVARICRTSVRPNQVTFVTMLIGIVVTFLFLTGRLWSGVVLAYVIEVLDGVDGKLARTKIETTAAGKREHVIDFVVEYSWWIALTFHFFKTTVSSAGWLLLLLAASDAVDRLAKRAVKKKVGRNLDDVANVDRFVRCIGARRNINIWILIAALAFGDAASGFVLICWWWAATAVVHVIRAWQICFSPPVVFDAR